MSQLLFTNCQIHKSAENTLPYNGTFIITKIKLMRSYEDKENIGISSAYLA